MIDAWSSSGLLALCGNWPKLLPWLSRWPVLDEHEAAGLLLVRRRTALALNFASSKLSTIVRLVLRATEIIDLCGHHFTYHRANITTNMVSENYGGFAA
jgi:hypothetical protein